MIGLWWNVTEMVSVDPSCAYRIDAAVVLLFAESTPLYVLSHLGGRGYTDILIIKIIVK